MENYEFNFINSIFTNNLDIMIQLQNFIYDTLMNFDNLNVSDTYNYYDTILIFYYQLIIFLFNNYNLYLVSSDQNKISRIYSSLSYRFSSLILKNVFKIKNDIDENNETLNKLILIRTDILSQISYINEKINQNQINQINQENSDILLNTESVDENNLLDNQILSDHKSSLRTFNKSNTDNTANTDNTENTDNTVNTVNTLIQTI